MLKDTHEIRDPIHVFVRLDSDERRVLDSRPFQRLRHIHQLALSHLVYPGATHRRFEHSLGVMELAGRVFDTVTHPEKVTDEIRRLLPEIADAGARDYWRRVLRMAALCHDVGHLPFSHAAERELLPSGWNHERLTREIILSQEMRAIWEGMTPPLRPDDVAKIAVGPRKAGESSFSNWEAILSEIIVGDAFGVDRMDYLVRDSHHAGVAYGRFDHYRLVDTLRILSLRGEEDEPMEPTLGIEEGGLHSAEALLLARYFMYTQMYFHPVRRIYDIHLKDFLGAWLSGGHFSTNLERHLSVTDNEVTAALLAAARQPAKKGHDAARRIVCRQHFRVLYQRHPEDVARNPEAGRAVFVAAQEKIGPHSVRHDKYTEGGGPPDFPVLPNDRSRPISSLVMSQVLRSLPVVAIDYVFIVPDRLEEAQRWLEANLQSILETRPEEEI